MELWGTLRAGQKKGIADLPPPIWVDMLLTAQILTALIAMRKIKGNYALMSNFVGDPSRIELISSVNVLILSLI